MAMGVIYLLTDASLHIRKAWCGTAVSPMHQQWRYCGIALKHLYSVKAVALCLTGTGPLDISIMTLCIPIKLTICVALKWQHVWHMNVICRPIHPVGLLLDCSISSAFTTGMLRSCTRPSTKCVDSGLVPDWHQVTVYIYDDLMYTHEIDYVCGIDVTIGVIQQCHMQTCISRWLDAGV